MFSGVYVSDPATFAFLYHHASSLSSRARSPDYTHRKDSPAPQEPGRVAADSGWAAMALDASHAASRDSRPAGSRRAGGQRGHRPHRYGSVANPGAGGRAPGPGGRKSTRL